MLQLLPCQDKLKSSHAMSGRTGTHSTALERDLEAPPADGSKIRPSDFPKGQGAGDDEVHLPVALCRRLALEKSLCSAGEVGIGCFLKVLVLVVIYPVCMPVCMHWFMHVCVSVHVRVHACMHPSIHPCMYACMLM